MKKELKAILIIGTILIAAVVSLSIILPYFKQSQPPTTSKGLVYIYVDSSIYNGLTSEIQQYEADVNNQGYSTEIFNWTSSNVAILKQNLTNAYPLGLKGAVLIGNIPHAIVDMWGQYASDFYLMDLDGQWDDINLPDGMPDGHSNGTGDMYPEIWIGRINPSSLNNLNITQAYKDYFVRNHAYRTGTLTRPHKALLYIDDSWSQWYDEYLSNFTAYTDVDCYWDNSTTIPANYLNNLTQNYEYVQLLVHSTQQDHYFGIGNPPSEGYVNYIDILNANTTPLFYNLYACSACDFTSSNNLGTQYLFSNSSLVVIGTTKTGGMNMYQSFYDELDKGEIIGNALKIWFRDPKYGPYGFWWDHQYSMGMTILGDPLLTI
jgi:hypothetical protein